PGPRLPLHDRPARPVSVGSEHNRRGEGAGPGRVPRVLGRDVPRAVRRAPSTDPRPVEELFVVGHGPRRRGNVTTVFGGPDVAPVAQTAPAPVKGCRGCSASSLSWRPRRGVPVEGDRQRVCTDCWKQATSY